MRNLRTFDQFINEFKQVGHIYHFTTTRGLLGILQDDEMHSAYGAISFTRNYNLKDWAIKFNAPVRIAFDGNVMSDRLKFQPFLYDPEKDPISGGQHMDSKKRRELYGQEREERVPKDVISKVKKYIIQIDVLDLGKQNDLHDLVKRVKAQNPGLQINIVKDFKPVHAGVLV